MRAGVHVRAAAYAGEHDGDAQLGATLGKRHEGAFVALRAYGAAVVQPHDHRARAAGKVIDGKVHERAGLYDEYVAAQAFGYGGAGSARFQLRDGERLFVVDVSAIRDAPDSAAVSPEHAVGVRGEQALRQVYAAHLAWVGVGNERAAYAAVADERHRARKVDETVGTGVGQGIERAYEHEGDGQIAEHAAEVVGREVQRVRAVREHDAVRALANRAAYRRRHAVERVLRDVLAEYLHRSVLGDARAAAFRQPPPRQLARLARGRDPPVLGLRAYRAARVYDAYVGYVFQCNAPYPISKRQVFPPSFLGHTPSAQRTATSLPSNTPSTPSA